MKHFIAVLTLTTLSFGAFAVDSASDNSDTLYLKGSVGKKISIKVNPTLAAEALNLVGVQNDVIVAQVTEKANVNAGYKVTITSANGGHLVNQDDNTQSISYTLKYNDALIELESPDNVDNNVASYSSKQLSPIDREVSISYTGATLEEDMLAGDYDDTVTFSIAAN